MPYVALKRMKWGPGREPLVLEAGDEVIPPFKRTLIDGVLKKIAEVPEVQGKKWVDQPIEVQQAWYDYSLSVGFHPSQLVRAPDAPPPGVTASGEAKADPSPPPPPSAEETKPRRKRGRPRK